MDFENWEKRKGPEETGRRRRAAAGVYAMAAALAVLACLAVINLIVSSLPAKYRTFDLTDQGLYSVGDMTKELLGSLSEDVRLLLLTETGQEDEGLEKLLDAYAAASPRIRVERVDIVARPGFAASYSEEDLSLNSVIAVCGDRHAAADYSTFYQYVNSGGTYGIGAYDAEGQITSAIARAVSAGERKIAFSTGHGELDPGTAFTEALDKAGISRTDVNLLTGTIPGDISALVIFSPEDDFTEEETDKVLNYLFDGGHVMLVTMPALVGGTKTPNLDRIPAAYGITRREGLVMEGDGSHFVQAPYLVVPTLSELSPVTAGLAGRNTIFALPEALELPDTDDAAYTVTALASSSGSSYLRTDIDTTLEKGEGDPEGPFTLAAIAEQTFSKDSFGTSDITGHEQEESPKAEEGAAGGQTKLLYFTTPCVFSPEALSTLIQQSTSLPEGNGALISRCLSALTDDETVVSIPAKTIHTPQTVIQTGIVNALGTLFMVILPVLTLAAGAAVFLIRRRR